MHRVRRALDQGVADMSTTHRQPWQCANCKQMVKFSQPFCGAVKSHGDSNLRHRISGTSKGTTINGVELRLQGGGHQKDGVGIRASSSSLTSRDPREAAKAMAKPWRHGSRRPLLGHRNHDQRLQLLGQSRVLLARTSTRSSWRVSRLRTVPLVRLHHQEWRRSWASSRQMVDAV